MHKKFYLSGLLSFFIISQSFAQTTELLLQNIQQIISTKKAFVGVSIMGNNGKDTLSLNGEKHFPMQSVFKIHIALAMLSEIDKQKFSIDQKVEILKKDLLPNLYSPIREDYPEGTTLTIGKIIQYMVSNSDNVGCEILLKLIGGPHVVEKFFIKNKFKDVSIKINEEVMQNNWDMQYQNWTTPKAANEVLGKFYNNRTKLLSKKSHHFIWRAMQETETGENRLRGNLPKNTIVMHKTGSSGTNKVGLTAAVNDIGVIFLPNGQHFFISVFVTESTENEQTNDKIIADISKAAWEYFMAKIK